MPTPQEQHAHATMLNDARNRQPQNLRYAFLFEGPRAVERWARKGVPAFVNVYKEGNRYFAGMPCTKRMNDGAQNLAYRVLVRWKGCD